MDGLTQVLEKALSDHAGAIKEFTEQTARRLQAVEQKLDSKPSGGPSHGNARGELAELLLKSDGLAAFQKGMSNSVEIQIPAQLFKAAIMNPYPLTNDNALVQAQRLPGIVTGPQRRFTVRDLFSQLPTASNLVEFTRELSFTNNAGPQYDAGSPGPNTEGALKNESAMSFQLANAPVATVAHWIPASRQILSDAPALQQHVEGRLLYGLKLEEERELMSGTGNVGELSGLLTNATAFNRGATNLTALDALALGVGQLIAGEFEPSGFILNPADWYSSKLLLAKDSQGRYLFGDPTGMTEARLWSLPIVVTNAMPVGQFMVLDARRVGFIADRENAVVRISESHADFFIRNMVVILCEERLALVIQQTAAMVYGSLSYAG